MGPCTSSSKGRKQAENQKQTSMQVKGVRSKFYDEIQRQISSINFTYSFSKKLSSQRLWVTIDAKQAYRQKSCAICLEQKQSSYLKTNCQHFFHINCLKKWLQIKDSCPICRAKIKETFVYCNKCGYQYFPFDNNFIHRAGQYHLCDGCMESSNYLEILRNVQCCLQQSQHWSQEQQLSQLSIDHMSGMYEINSINSR